jgi:WD40 repeat protein
MIYQKLVLGFPAYCAEWCCVPIGDVEGSSAAAIAVGGGGGGSKSGVPNRIVIYSVTTVGGVPEIKLAHETDTSPAVASGLAVDSTGKLLAACFSKDIAVYAVKPTGLVLLAQFTADWAKQDPTVTSIAFRPAQSADEVAAADTAGVQQADQCTFMLASGGDDGAVRVWKLSMSEQVQSKFLMVLKINAMPFTDKFALSNACCDRICKKPVRRCLLLTLVRVQHWKC